MAGRITAVTRLLVLLTIVHRDLSLPPKITALVRQNLFTVEVPGDRADIPSLEFPAESPAAPAYVHRVSTVVDNYFGGSK